MKNIALLVVLVTFFGCSGAKEGLAKVCPINLVPGKSLGNIAIGKTLKEVEKAGHQVAHTDYGIVVDKIFAVVTCDKKIITVYLQNIDKSPDCVSVDGKKVSLKADIPTLKKQFNLPQCQMQMLKAGDRFYYCQNRGLTIGVGVVPTQSGFQESKFTHLGVIKPGFRHNTFHLFCKEIE